jgi:hypothetical protein
MEWLAERLSRIPGVVAVTLGGSRALGTQRPDSDWDFGLYYTDTIDPDDVRALGYEGTVVAPGEWAYPMNGGAWLRIDGQSVDLLYREQADVQRWTAEANDGRWELFRVPGYLCGMASYVLVGEAAVGRVLAGTLDQPPFPVRLGRDGPRKWVWEARFWLRHASSHAAAGDVAACIGKCSAAVVAVAQARLLERREWALNEKGIVARAGLADVEALLLRRTDMPGLVDEIRTALEVEND